MHLINRRTFHDSSKTGPYPEQEVREVHASEFSSAVLYGSFPGPPETPGVEARYSVRLASVRALLRTWVDIHPETRAGTDGIGGRQLRISRDRLGKPYLYLTSVFGTRKYILSPSFSSFGNILWAALGSADCGIGIDAAGPDEFEATYPFSRAFGTEELQAAVKRNGGDLPAAAADLWSMKEAAVKALGCGFHLIDPRDVTVSPADRGTAPDGYFVHISAGAGERLGSSGSLKIPVVLIRHDSVSVSVAQTTALSPGNRKCRRDTYHSGTFE